MTILVAVRNPVSLLLPLAVRSDRYPHRIPTQLTCRSCGNKTGTVLCRSGVCQIVVRINDFLIFLLSAIISLLFIKNVVRYKLRICKYKDSMQKEGRLR